VLYDEGKINAIKEYLTKKRHTLAVAESVTSGHLQAAFSLAQQASDYFQGGITAYNAGQKTRHLNIEPINALKSDCVSDGVARQMAIQVSNMFLSDYGISITGYAVKVPEQGIKALFAYCAIAFQGNIILEKKLTSNKEEGVAVQLDYTAQVIDALFKLVTKAKARKAR
jgi:nicotinamide-nucleotide amidase